MATVGANRSARLHDGRMAAGESFAERPAVHDGLPTNRPLNRCRQSVSAPSMVVPHRIDADSSSKRAKTRTALLCIPRWPVSAPTMLWRRPARSCSRPGVSADIERRRGVGDPVLVAAHGVHLRAHASLGAARWPSLLALTTPPRIAHGRLPTDIQGDHADLAMPWPRRWRLARPRSRPRYMAIEQAVADPDQDLALPFLRAGLFRPRVSAAFPGSD